MDTRELSLLQNGNMNETDNDVRKGSFRRCVYTLTVMLAMMNAVSLIPALVYFNPL